jgi:hypothetical protein
MMRTIKSRTLLLLYSIAAIMFFVYALGHKWASRNSTKNNITLHTFQTSIGWGYRIDIEKQTYINQPFIPVIETHEGFATQEIAEKVGKIVVTKIESKQRPVVTINDLISCGVIIHDKPVIPNPTN